MDVVAITGAGGYIGSRLAQVLALQSTTEVRALVRRGEPPQCASLSRLFVVRGSIADPSVLAELLRPRCIVVNFAYDAGASPAENLATAEALGDACRAYGVERMIHCSTAAVVGRVNTGRVDESTPCRPWTDYEKTKFAIENLLREKARGKFELAIVRPTAVFGPGSRNLLKMARNLTRGTRLASYLLSCLNNRRRMNLVASENVVATIVFLLESARPFDQDVFIISDDEAAENNFRDVELHLMQAFGITDYAVPRIVFPRVLLSLLLRMRGRSLINPETAFVCDKLINFGLQKPVGFAAGLTAFAEWYKNTPARHVHPS